MKKFIVTAGVAALGIVLAPAFAEETATALEEATPPAAGDAVAGKKVFRQCGACHSVEAGQNRIGPHLAGLWGREAGTVEGFRYSPAMKSSGIVWGDDTLPGYLADPKGTVQGTTMLIGVRKDSDIPDLMAYLKEATASE